LPADPAERRSFHGRSFLHIPAGSRRLRSGPLDRRRQDGYAADRSPATRNQAVASAGALHGQRDLDESFSGTVAAASAIQLADGSGYFWFFSSEDVDLTIKMVGFDPPFWFFAASGTDVLFTINVTDTWLNRTVTYQNPSGVNQNILDFTSFGPP
jgi:hypothetical protein